MAFAFKDYNKLRSDALDIEKNMLRDKKKDSVEDLEEPRKSQLQFLQYVVGHLDKAGKDMDSSQKGLVLHGAMMLLVYRINKEMGLIQHNSFLRDRLTSVMDIEQNPPTHEQYGLCFHSLNKFLGNIFINSDPRQGLIKDLTPYKISLEQLVKLTKASYRQEREHLKKEARYLKNAEEDVPAPAAIPPISSVIPTKIQTQIKSWKDLKRDLHNLVQTELEDKRAGGVNRIGNNTRAAQLDFLQAVKKSLEEAQVLAPANKDASVSSSSTKAKGKNKGKNSYNGQAAESSADKAPEENTGPEATPMPDTQKAAILAGAMFIVRGLIDIEYSAAPLNQKSENNSKIHTELSKILDVTNQSTEDMKTVVQITYGYIRVMALANTGTNDCSQIRKTHLFSNVAHFDLRNYLSQIAEILYQCRNSVIKACEPPKEQKSKASAVGWGASLGGMFAKKSATTNSDSDDDDLDDVAKDDAGASSSTSATL